MPHKTAAPHPHLPTHKTDGSRSKSIRCFTNRELATVLHALRCLQNTGCLKSECNHFDEAGQLADDEIDALCERLNFAKLL